MEITREQLDELRKQYPQAKYIEKNAHRMGFVGGSDGAIIMGVSTYKTPTQLYYEKRGELPLDDLDDQVNVAFGTLLEDAIAEFYMRQTGQVLHRVNTHQVHRGHPWMRAQIDRRKVGVREHVECKNTNPFWFSSDDWGVPGTDQVPHPYLIQCQHQLEVIGYDVCDLAVLVGNSKFAIYRIERDDDLIRMMVEMEAEFWDCVRSGNPPQIDYSHKTAVDFMKKRYPGTNGQVVDLPAEAVELRQRDQALLRIVNEAVKERDTIQAELLELMGEAAVGVLPGDQGGFTRKLVAACDIAYTRSEYVALRFTKKPKVN